MEGKTTYEIKGHKITIKEPEFKELALGLATLTTTTGNMDLAGAGMRILETCAEDKALVENMKKTEPRTLIGLCIKICEDYVLPTDEEIKKN